MGQWGFHSDEGDAAMDGVGEIKIKCGIVADSDAEEFEDIEDAQKLADAQDSALLHKETARFYDHSVVSTTISFLRDGFRVPEDVLDIVEERLEGLDDEDHASFSDPAARAAAVAKELEMVRAARRNGGRLEPEQRGHAKGLFETLASKEDPEGYAEAVQAAQDAREASVIPGADEVPRSPFVWLDSAKIGTLGRVAKALKIQGANERADVVRAIKAHPNRWLARRFAPYHRGV